MRTLRVQDIPPPLEREEQTAIFRWVQVAKGRYPELTLLYHVANEAGSRGRREMAMLKAEGVRAGVPDLCLPVARGGFHGLYIELKRQRGGKVSEIQQAWIDALLAQGYAVRVCRGAEEAIQTLENYLNGGKTTPEKPEKPET